MSVRISLADRLAVMHAGRLLQVGAPEEVYTAPVSPLVAEFTGVAGSLAVTVGGEHARAPHEGTETMAFQAPSSGLRGSGAWCARAVTGSPGPALLMLRPESVVVGAPSQPGSIPAVVRTVAYRGRGYEYEVGLADGTTLRGIPSGRRWARGANVGVSASGEGCLLFPIATTEASAHLFSEGEIAFSEGEIAFSEGEIAVEH